MPGESVPQGLWLPPRVATLLVAASNSLDRTRAQADYICDGVADEVQINAALNALPAGYGRVMLSEGTFNIVDPITIPGSYIVLEGNGWETIINSSAANYAVSLNGSFSQVKNLKIVIAAGAGAVGTRPNGIQAANISDLIVEHVWIIGDLTVAEDGSEDRQCGIHWNTVSNSKIEGCKVGNFNYYNIQLVGCLGNRVYANTCSWDGTNPGNVNIGQLGIRLKNGSNHNLISNNQCFEHKFVGIEIYNVAPNTSIENVIDGNVCRSNMKEGIILETNCHYNVISNNSCGDNGEDGIRIQTTGNIGNQISNNVCYANTRHGIAIDLTAEETTIEGNLCFGNGYYGIITSGPRNSIIGNFVVQSDYHGIYVDGPDTKVNDNFVYDNGQHAAGTYNGIHITGLADRSSIVGNHCMDPGDSQEDGIHLADGATHVQIVGNYCYNGMGDGIELEANNDYCLIKDNYCLENDDYGIAISAASCNENTVENNKLVGNLLGAINDAGTDTILPEVVIDAPNPDSNIGDFPAQQMLNNVDTEIRMKLHCPSEFQELVRAHIIVVPGASGNLRRSVDTDWGKICVSEVYNTDTGAIAAGQVAVTINELECLDITAALTGAGAIAAGDWIGVLFERIASHASDTVEATVWLLGLRMQYV